MNNYLIVTLFIVLGLIVWLMWEIHQKLHKILEIHWQSMIAIEQRLDALINAVKRFDTK